MSGKITLVPINKGIRTDRTAFNIDNDAFPTLINAYQWRGRIKRKRGTSLLTRLQRVYTFTNETLSSGSITLNISIVPGTVNVTVSTTVYTDPNKDGTLSPGGSINYSTGQLSIPSGGSNAITGSVGYYPLLPVMGLEPFVVPTSAFPQTIGFDTTYSYNILTTSPYNSYDVSLYKNPSLDPTNYPGYVRKTSQTSTSWNGKDYQQFWSVNYQGAMWATNGMQTPFSPANIGMQYKPISTVTVVNATSATLAITNHGLVQGDFVFINEVTTTTGINFQTGYVTSANPQNANQVTVTFPFATLATDGTGGICQYLTNRSDTTKDCLRWYDGDPSTNSGFGWVNFAPPLSQFNYSVSDNPAAQYYLVGAKMIVPFKDRLLFLGPVIQTSSPGSQRYLQDTIIYSQNGTPYYTASFTGDPALVTTSFNPMLVPANQTATASAFFEDQTGFGGYNQAGIDQPITTVSSNEDVLIVGFTVMQTRFVFTGNDLLPFAFYTINSELGSLSTFSSVNLDRGVITVGTNGFVITTQTSAERIDLEIPDQIFQFNLTENGASRICSQRDFINEWIYFSYLDNEHQSLFPNQTLQYNYRDQSWAIFNESYSTYGSFRRKTGLTWATIGNIFSRWSEWSEPWNAGSSTLLQPEVIAGNQQGFVVSRDQGTGEANSLAISNIVGSTITCTNHGLNPGDYIVINGAVGTVGPQINGKIFSINYVDTDTFTLNPALDGGPYTYLGLGLIQRMYVPIIITKQFPIAWEMGRKTRIGVQQYLLSTTNKGQITVNIYLNQDANNAYNSLKSNPNPNSLVYSQIVYTCPESSNLGLTPANSNLQMPTAINQQQIWHRMNTSMIGDTVQIGITLSDKQMRDIGFFNQFAEIELHGIIFSISPSSLLA